MEAINQESPCPQNARSQVNVLMEIDLNIDTGDAVDEVDLNVAIDQLKSTECLNEANKENNHLGAREHLTELDYSHGR